MRKVFSIAERVLLESLRGHQFELCMKQLECMEAVLCMAAAPRSIPYTRANFYLKEIQKFREGPKAISRKSTPGAVITWTEGVDELWIGLKNEIAAALHGERSKSRNLSVSG